LYMGGEGRSNGVGIIMSEKISKQVVRVERWEGRIVMAWEVIQRQMACCVGIWATKRKD